MHEEYKTNRIVGLIGTLTVHTLVLLLILVKSPPSEEVSESAPPLGDPVSVTLLFSGETVPDGMSNNPPLYTASGEVCPPSSKTYLGMGIVFDIDTGEIFQAPSVLPAYKAGIRVGDLMMNNPNPDDNDMMYPVILRGDMQLTFAIKATQICYTTDPVTSV